MEMIFINMKTKLNIIKTFKSISFSLIKKDDNR